MRQRLTRALAFVLAACLTSSPALLAQQDTNQQQTKQQKKDQQEREARERARRDELPYAYKAWLAEVEDIIRPEELDAFRRLSSKEERENYIEILFWGMRDPTPDTVENELRDEHYRRIAYANERFASGIPGNKTDRGRMYIKWGAPDEIESHPTGGPYDRPSHEGGGRTTTHAYEKWRYRNLAGVGSDIVIEFVDRSGSGEYRMTTDPSEKDALTYIPGAGLSDLEAMNLDSKLGRFTRTDGTHLPASLTGMPAGMNQFERMEQSARLWQAPGQFKTLEQMVTSRVVRDELKFAFRFDFIRITATSVLVPVTLQIPNREMHFEFAAGLHTATLNVYVRVSTPGGRVVQVFEDAIRRDLPDSTFRGELEGHSVYQRALPLRPGLYKLNVVIKDVTSGDVGTIAERLPVPRFEPEQLTSSTLILADRIEPVAPGTLGLGPFVLGASKVRPRMSAAFTSDESLGVYLQVYNLALDPATGKPSAIVRYRILDERKHDAGPDGKRAASAGSRHVDARGASALNPLANGFTDANESAQPPVLDATESVAALNHRGRQITLEKMLPLRGLAAGRYSIEVVVADHVSGQSVKQRASFTVAPGR